MNRLRLLRLISLFVVMPNYPHSVCRMGAPICRAWRVLLAHAVIYRQSMLSNIEGPKRRTAARGLSCSASPAGSYRSESERDVRRSHFARLLSGLIGLLVLSGCQQQDAPITSAPPPHRTSITA